MSIHKVEITDTYVRVWKSSNKFVDFVYADIPPGTVEEKRTWLLENGQSYLDFEQRTNQLPQDDPDRDTDPGLPHLFWRVDGNRTWLVSRSILLVDIVFDAAAGYWVPTFRTF